MKDECDWNVLDMYMKLSKNKLMFKKKERRKGKGGKFINFHELGMVSSVSALGRQRRANL